MDMDNRLGIVGVEGRQGRGKHQGIFGTTVIEQLKKNKSIWPIKVRALKKIKANGGFKYGFDIS